MVLTSSLFAYVVILFRLPLDWIDRLCRGGSGWLEDRIRQYALAGAGFYSVISAALLLGLGIEWSPIDPIKVLYWSN